MSSPKHFPLFSFPPLRSFRSVYTAARTLSTENSNLQGPHQTGTLDEDDDQQQQASTEIDPSDPWSNMNYIFDNNFMTAEFLRMPRAFLRPGSRAYSVPANMSKDLVSIGFQLTQIRFVRSFQRLPCRSSSRRTEVKNPRRKNRNVRPVRMRAIGNRCRKMTIKSPPVIRTILAVHRCSAVRKFVTWTMAISKRRMRISMISAWRCMARVIS